MPAVPFRSFSTGGVGMDRDDKDQHDALEKIARADANLARHERLSAISLLLLSLIAVFALGLLISCIAGVP